MNCIIIEDQLPARRILEKYIADAGTLKLAGTYGDALSAMEALKSQKIDLMFLDIHLPKLSGIDFLKTLPNPPQVILTTAFSEYAIESYELNVVDYLLKPFSFQRFIKAIAKVEILSNQESESTAKRETDNDNVEKERLNEIYLKSGYDHIRIETETIVYIMADSDYTEIHLKERKHLSSESLRYWEEHLSNRHFMRIHKSYIINTNKITRISGNQVYLENNKIIPIGRAYKSSFADRFLNEKSKG